MKKSPISDADKVQLFMTASIAGAAGWKTKSQHPSISREKMIFLYMVDPRTQTTFAAGVSRDFFKFVTGTIQRDPTLHASAQSSCGAAIINYITAAQSKRADSELKELESTLACGIAAYAGVTRSLQRADNLASGGHFIIVYYQKEGESSGLMRPVVSTTQPDTIMPVDALQHLVLAAMTHDRNNNPHWFA